MGVGSGRPISGNCPERSGSSMGVPKDRLLLDAVLEVSRPNGSRHRSDVTAESLSAAVVSLSLPRSFNRLKPESARSKLNGKSLLMCTLGMTDTFTGMSVNMERL